MPARMGALLQNRAVELYRRLGFLETGRTHTHLLFEWSPPREAATRGSGDERPPTGAYIDGYWNRITFAPTVGGAGQASGCSLEDPGQGPMQIALPHPYFVPNDGLFRYVYYWDTYFMFRGLLEAWPAVARAVHKHLFARHPDLTDVAESARLRLEAVDRAYPPDRLSRDNFDDLVERALALRRVHYGITSPIIHLSEFLLRYGLQEQGIIVNSQLAPAWAEAVVGRGDSPEGPAGIHLEPAPRAADAGRDAGDEGPDSGHEGRPGVVGHWGGGRLRAGGC